MGRWTRSHSAERTRASRPRFRFAAGVVVGLVAAGGIAMASIPDSRSGQVTACYRTSDPNKGALRVIDAQAGQTCRGGEARLTWDSTRLTWRGEWNPTTQYVRGDIVVVAGSSYLARSSNTGSSPPTSPTVWGLLAQAGATGPEGPQGPQGEPGPGIDHLNDLNGIGCDGPDSRNYYVQVSGSSIQCVTNEDPPPSPLVVGPNPLHFPFTSYPWTPVIRTVTVTNAGDVPIRSGAGQPNDFPDDDYNEWGRVTEDTCDVTLDPGQSCTATITAYEPFPDDWANGFEYGFTFEIGDKTISLTSSVEGALLTHNGPSVSGLQFLKVGQPLIITNIGGTVTSPLTVTLRDTATQTLTDDTCSGAVLAPSASCAVTVQLVEQAEDFNYLTIGGAPVYWDREQIISVDPF